MAAPLYKMLGQSNPAATTDATVYTVPTGRRAIISCCSIAEVGGADATVRVCITTGSTTTKGTALLWNTTVASTTRFGICEGWTLDAGAKIVMQASTANVTLTLFGEEADA